MVKVDSKALLESSLKNRDKKIIITEKRIVKGLKVLDKVSIKDSDRNRCKYSLRSKSADAAFLGFIGFAPMVSDMGNISFMQAMGVISSVGLNETLVIFADYNIIYKDDEIILTKA
ncbi:hypothetical protein [Paraclostridium sordellii]|uniref:hypothetical protein n=1 Tax=Paraclostridium sordellii TaxID=1505 RepID=UPI0005DF21E9|nr:hypothetical protein [Paeniclostridium sordellii]CEP83118.1 Uncharacterised protein [[Clostridium] sordellii] [Paeniclostridium sordellii]